MGGHRQFRARCRSFAGSGISSAHQTCHFNAYTTLTVTPSADSSQTKRNIDHQHRLTLQPRRQSLQWLNHPFKIRVNPDEALVLITAADVLIVEGGRVAQSLRKRHQEALRQMHMHPPQMEEMTKMTQRKRKRILNRTKPRNRTCVGSARNPLNIMRSRNAITGRATSVHYACVRCTKSWIVHFARCALCLHYISW